jgi:hypothetical protein
MRTVLIGSDFAYNANGVLKPIEINTNVGFSKGQLEDINNIFDITHLTNFVTENAFVKIHYIGHAKEIEDILSNISTALNIEFEHHIIELGSITIPFVEDTDDILIIRSAYDTTAIVDDSYCRDKIGFLNLIQSESFGSQFAYLNEEGTLVSNITTIPDNGVHPNFILKARYPTYDKTVYPKLYKVSTQSELDAILENVTDEYFIMEYYYNALYNVNGKVTKKRSLNIVYPPTLESIPLGKYTDTTRQRVIDSPIYDLSTFELNSNLRDAYITVDGKVLNLPKLLDTDLVQMGDGTFKTGLELQIDDVVKTINIPNVENVDSINESTNYKIDLESFISGSTYSTNKVINKVRVDADINIIQIVFTDDTTWEDTVNSRYLVERDNEVRFLRLDELINGDIIILIDTTDATKVNVVPKTVQSTEVIKKEFSGWVITVERKHIFLTVTDNSNTNLSYAAIEHNAGSGRACFSLCYNCGCGGCPKNERCNPFFTCQTPCYF